MLFSVCIPVYNCSGFIARCVESILTQSFSDYEIVIVDDGSTDYSFKICQQYADSYSCIHVVTQANAGPAAARNAAIALAKGEYILFVDADDEVLPGYFEILDNYIKMHPCPLYWFGSRHDNGKQIVDKTSTFAFLEGKDDILDFLEYQLCKSISNNKFIAYSSNCDTHSSCNKAISRSLIDQGARYPVGTVVEEDLRFNLQLLDNSDSLCVIPDVLYCYHQQAAGSVTTKYNPRKFESKLAAYRDETAFADRNGRPNIKNFFQDSLISYVSSCINNLMYDTCSLTYGQKIAEIQRYFLSDEVQLANREFTPRSMRTRIMRLLIQFKLYRIGYALHSIGQVVR